VKKKILLLSDDMRMTSGVATMSKEIVLGTVDKFDWVQLGALIKHPHYGKIIDVSEDVKLRTGVHDANVKIYPNNGYGDIVTLRRIIKAEKPDAILHFTDPHFWKWLYDNEHEIRQTIPILYYHVWDNLPTPKWNKSYYESCDWIGCISLLTYGIVKRLCNEFKEDQISYVPHGVNKNIFKPLTNVSQTIKNYINGDKEYSFILFFNNRNIRRKHPANVIYSYKLFCDNLPKVESDKCLLLMHTEPVDENGTDLTAIISDLCPDYNIKFTNVKFEQDELNQIYNHVDCTINISNNEGFGLTTLESLMSGTPIIVNVTGGLQDQCGFNLKPYDYFILGTLSGNKSYEKNLKHGEWAFPVWPSSTLINGSIPTPYIFEDNLNIEDISKTIMNVYKIDKDKRKEIGLLGNKFAIDNFSSEIMCEKLSEGIENTINNFQQKEKYNLYKII
jgi:glycosyltransferase involved in cell wall biosynthesis